jgi:hypothetical protein
VDANKPRRRWLLFGIGGMLLVVIGVAVGIVALQSYWKSRQQAQQRAAAAAVEKLGGETQHAFSSASPLSMFLERGDAPNLLYLSNKKITDDDLVVFESAPATRALHLFDNRITDDGLVHLKNLAALEQLDLRRNNITDAGLVHLEGLRNLQNLYLIRTQVSPAGVAKLQKHLPTTKIYTNRGAGTGNTGVGEAPPQPVPSN